jgi:hypothetical protein
MAKGFVWPPRSGEGMEGRPTGTARVCELLSSMEGQRELFLLRKVT